MTITLNQAREATKAVVEEQGADFRYVIDRVKNGGAVCYYVPLPASVAAEYNDPQKATTGCLIGRVLDRLGETRQRNDNAGGSRAAVGLGHQGSVNNLSISYPGMFADDGVVHYLLLAQTAQDVGMTWGEAYTYAERYAIDGTGQSSYPNLMTEISDWKPETEGEGE